MRVHQLKINPTKSFLGVASSNSWDCRDIYKEIHLDSDKIHAIQKI